MKWNPKNVQAKLIPEVRQAKLIDYVKRLEQENSLLRQGLTPNSSPQALKRNMMAALPPELRPGNIGDLTKIIWPFWFPSTRVRLAPLESKRASFTVTQEASFIITSLVKVVHKNVAGVATYIDPQNFNTGQANANNLNFTIRDASSSRDFMQLPIALDHVGNPQQPTVFPTPMLIRENGTVEYQLTNDDPVETYHPSIIMFGYRVRLSEWEKLLSQVTG